MSAPPLQHAHPPGRAVRAAPAGPGDALHLRAHRLQLRPHRQLPDLPVRGPAAPLAGGERVRGLPRHEPHRRGRPDDRRRRAGRAAAPGLRAAVHRRLSRGPALPPHPDGARSIRGRPTTSRRWSRWSRGCSPRASPTRGEDGSVYFAIARFPAYGRLSQLDKRELKTGASERVSDDEYAKEDARDFALWKAAQPEDEAVGAAWDAPFGRGRPGWHLECSAMALELVRRAWGIDVLDIHAGGVDLIFPHHEDEIAQSCAYTGQELFARYWVHGEFLNIRGSKMSKRYGNITTARDLREDGVDAGAVRLLMFQAHYRQKLDLTDEALASAREGSRRLGEFQHRLAGRRRPGRRGAVRRGGRPPGPGAHRGAGRRPQRPARGGRGVQLRVGGQRGARRRACRRAPGRHRLASAEGVLGVTSSVEMVRVGTADVAASAELDGEQPPSGRRWRPARLGRPVGGPAKGREDGAGLRRG